MSSREGSEPKLKNPLDDLVHIASNMSRDLGHPNLVKEENQSPMTHPRALSSGAHSRPYSPNEYITTQGGATTNQSPMSYSNSATPPLVSSPSNKPQKSKRMACVECRQQKSRCDAHERYPDSCTRCSKKGLACDLKSDYKRTYKRARIAQIEKEFLELKKSLTSAQAAELSARYPSLVENVDENEAPPPEQKNSSPSHNTAPYKPTSSFRVLKAKDEKMAANDTHEKYSDSRVNNEHRGGGDGEAFNSGPSSKYMSIPRDLHILDQESILQTFNVTEQVLICDEKTVDSISISPQKIKSLFVEYVTRYHPILPVVDVSKGPARIYRLCPALFWVIIFVSLRRSNEDPSRSLLIQLSPIVKGILAEIMISPITRYNPSEEEEPILNVSSVYSVQAFLLYSFWPPITSSLSADSSYATVNTGFFQAMRIGLHAPSSFIEDSESGIEAKTASKTSTSLQAPMIQEQIKTWIVSNVASQYIATAFGFPACVQFDSSIWYYSRPDSEISIQENVKVMLEIAQFEDQMAKSLNSNPVDPCGLADASERVSLLKLLTKRLDEVEDRVRNSSIRHSLSFRIFEVLSTRIHLFSYYFMDSTKLPPFELKKGLIKLYNAANALVEFTKQCQARDKKYVKYLPGVYLLNLWQAACIIGKLVHSDLKDFIDVSAGRRNFEAVVSLTAKGSILKHDMAFRSSGITRSMWPLFKSLDEEKMNSLGVSVRNRMSASVFFDCLNLVRKQVGMTKLNRKTDVAGAETDALAAVDTSAQAGHDHDHEHEHGHENEHDHNQHENGHEHEHSQSEAEEDSVAVATGTGADVDVAGSAQSKKSNRSFSNSDNAELRARQIIRTIPLDPEPISAESSKRSSIFKIVNSSADSSPLAKSDAGSPGVGVVSNFKKPHRSIEAGSIVEQHASRPRQLVNSDSVAGAHNMGHLAYTVPQQVPNDTILPVAGVPHVQHSPHVPHVSQATQLQHVPHAPPHVPRAPHAPQYLPQNTTSQHHQQQQPYSNQSFNDSPAQSGYESLDLDGFDSELLWRDVDSVMHEFGFHLG
ncbi:uncharacterized protein LODBEIA_P55100 [Lodderomyces beijingensis]|uniref:Zn(2)-C6 fungal-type domain-containing protein n=1 Tax=Lodderomyces beijingensis TaxID=1775926 RepID=A0ABP0ZVH7_9ASCO